MSRSVLTDEFDGETHEQSQFVPVKLAYARPVVVAHGNLREITLIIGHTSVKCDNTSGSCHSYTRTN